MESKERLQNEHLRANPLLAWDHYLGLRGAGLILYGALPASLGALGALTPPQPSKLFSMGLDGLPLLGVVAVIPVVMTFVLVRQRLANWYLLRDCLWMRSATITVGIVVASTLICLATGVLTSLYLPLAPDEWWALPFAEKAKPIAHSLLLSFAYLVGSSTLFLAVIKEDSTLPLLPGKTEVEYIGLLRGHLKDVVNSKLHSEHPTQNDGVLNERLDRLKEAISNARSVLEVLRVQSTANARGRLYEQIEKELEALSAAAGDVRQSYATWPNYWGETSTALNTEQRDRRSKIASLRGVNLGG